MATLQALPTLEEAVYTDTIDDAIVYFREIDPEHVYNIADAYKCAVQQYFAHSTGDQTIACNTSRIFNRKNVDDEDWNDEISFPEGHWARQLQRKLLGDEYPGYYFTPTQVVQTLEAIKENNQ
jgi:hypothetical protein